jgi:hypothetical protein
MKKQFSNKAVIAMLMLLISGCNSVGNTCVTGGCYGPFEVVIKTEKGEKVEDVIVILAYVTASGYSEGMESTYSETALSDTDKKILFPRGFVYRTDGPTLQMSLSIIHPDYKSLSHSAGFPDKQGVIDLGDKFMRRRQDAIDASIASSEANLRKAGFSEEEIESKFKGKRKHNALMRMSLSTKYFAHAVTIGRGEIIDKYLPQWLEEYIEYSESIGKPIGKNYEELYQIYYDAILERAQRYAR